MVLKILTKQFGIVDHGLCSIRTAKAETEQRISGGSVRRWNGHSVHVRFESYASM
jgi:hypothetical protein